MKRLLYFGYFIKNTNYSNLKRNFIDTKKDEQLSYFKIFIDMIISSFKYKSSFHDYFMFEFYTKNHEQKDSYLTTGRSYEFYTRLNDKDKINYFRNKAKFNTVFSDFIKRDFIFLKNRTLDDFIEWVDGKNCIIAKPNYGVAGRGIEKIYIDDYNSSETLYNYLKRQKLELVEELIQQHSDMAKINNSSVNTVRIITVENGGGGIDVVGAILRIGIGNHVDNFSAGGIAAPIDIATGRVYGPAISKRNLTKYEHHPSTMHKITGFTVPYWNEIIELVGKASKIVPGVKTVGWDIAITENGPELIVVQDFMEGKEFTVDVFLDFDGNLITVVPRLRMATRSGEISKGKIIKDKEIIEDIKRLVEVLKPIGHITVQLMKTNKGIEYIEINPRFGGGAPMSIQSGADSCENLYRLLMGENLEYNENYRDNIMFFRFDNSICVDENLEIVQW